MKHPLLLTILSVVTLGVLGACEKPCEKAYKKTVECIDKEGVQKSVASRKELVVKLCTPYEEEVKECIKETDCVKFTNCMTRATSSLRAIKPRSMSAEEPSPKSGKDMKPEPSTPMKGMIAPMTEENFSIK